MEPNHNRFKAVKGAMAEASPRAKEEVVDMGEDLLREVSQVQEIREMEEPNLELDHLQMRSILANEYYCNHSFLYDITDQYLSKIYHKYFP